MQDSPRLTMVVLDPAEEWRDGGQLAERISKWTKERGQLAATLPRSAGLVHKEAWTRVERVCRATAGLAASRP